MNPSIERTVAAILVPLGPHGTPALAEAIRTGVARAFAACPDAVGLDVVPQYDDRHRITDVAITPLATIEAMHEAAHRHLADARARARDVPRTAPDSTCPRCAATVALLATRCPACGALLAQPTATLTEGASAPTTPEGAEPPTEEHDHAKR